MDFASRGDGNTQFQIAPMIDIVFILLIWLVVTYASVEEERLIDIHLPAAENTVPEKRSLREIKVNLDAKGRISLYRRTYTPEAFEKRLRRLAEFTEDPGVIIRADAECAHKYVVRVMDICHQVDVRRVFFSTTPAAAAEEGP